MESRVPDWRFSLGVATTGNQALSTANKLLRLFEEDRTGIKTLGRASDSVLELQHFFKRRPIVSVPEAHRELKISIPTLHAFTKHLVNLGILRELSGKTRYRVFS